jgi:hypothetical protein
MLMHMNRSSTAGGGAAILQPRAVPFPTVHLVSSEPAPGGGLWQIVPQGKYQEAAKEYAKAGKVEVAMEMFSDLRQFDEAKTWAEQYARARGGDNSSVQVR